MNPHQDRYFRVNLAFDHGDVQQVVHVILIDDRSKVSGNGGGNNGFGGPVHEGFDPHAVFN